MTSSFCTFVRLHVGMHEAAGFANVHYAVVGKACNGKSLHVGLHMLRIIRSSAFALLGIEVCSPPVAWGFGNAQRFNCFERSRISFHKS